MLKKTSSLLLALLMLSWLPASRADTGVSADLQVALLYKIFEFDQSLSDVKGPAIVVGVFYDAANAQSQQAGKEIVQAFFRVGMRTIAGKQVVIKEMTDPGMLADGVQILYVTPGNDSGVADLVKLCEKGKIFGISGTEQYARDGLPLAIGVENNKPKIIVNQAGSARCGVKLSSKLLALARIL